MTHVLRILMRSLARAAAKCCGLVVVLAAGAAGAADAPARSSAAPVVHVTASLIARAPSEGEAHVAWLGVRMVHRAGWHTYWKNPGDSGMPTTIEWQLPEGWSANPIDWPAPTRLQAGPLASYGYTGTLVLPVMLFAPRDWAAGSPAHFAANVSWLACAEVCIPEHAHLELDLPAPRRSADQALMERFLARTPQAFDFARASVARAGGRLELNLDPARAGEFFPDMEELITPGVVPQVSRDGSEVLWSAPLGEAGRRLAVGTRISGVWVEPGRRPRRVEAALDVH
jgi:thiol:disulfide interchange protein DsbD